MYTWVPSNKVYEFNGSTWNPVGGYSASWSARIEGCMESLNSNLYVFGGYDISVEIADTWISINSGENWAQTAYYEDGTKAILLDEDNGKFEGETYFAPRDGCPYCKHIDNGTEYAYITGAGNIVGSMGTEVWRTADGTNWEFLCAGQLISNQTGAMISFGGKLWSLGGYDNNGAGYTNYIYCSEDGGYTWLRKNNANWGGRRGHRAFVLSDHLYITGGDGTGGWHNDVWRYDTLADGSGTDSWTDVSPSSAYPARSFLGSGVISGRVYIFGGASTGWTTWYDTMYSWAEGEANWTYESSFPLPTPMNLNMCAEKDNKIFIYGGLGQSWTPYYNTVYTFDGSTAWSLNPNTPTFEARQGGGFVNLNGNFLQYAGHNGTNPIADCWISTDDCDSWTRTYLYDVTKCSGAITTGGKDLSAEFTTDKNGNTRTVWSIGCYNKT